MLAGKKREAESIHFFRQSSSKRKSFAQISVFHQIYSCLSLANFPAAVVVSRLYHTKVMQKQLTRDSSEKKLKIMLQELGFETQFVDDQVPRKSDPGCRAIALIAKRQSQKI